MKLFYQQLTSHLKNQLLPIYLISGDEYFLVQESRDLIRNKAKNQGFSEILRFETNKEFDWNTLIEANNSLSLFGDKTYIEIKLTQKPTGSATKLFIHFLEHLHPSTLVVILSNKLDAAAQRAGWFQTISAVGAHLAIWPFDANKFRDWVEKRLRHYQLQCDRDAIQFLITQTEGNLLACAQEIEKLTLLSQGSITLAEMKTAISDNAHFDIFTLTDTVLEGNTNKTLRVLSKLREQTVEPILIQWALTRELRLLVGIHSELGKKKDWTSICKKYQIWDKKQPLIRKMLQRHPIQKLHQLLLLSGQIDRMTKGLLRGNVWDEIQTLVMAMCYT